MTGDEVYFISEEIKLVGSPFTFLESGYNRFAK